MKYNFIIERTVEHLKGFEITRWCSCLSYWAVGVIQSQNFDIFFSPARKSLVAFLDLNNKVRNNYEAQVVTYCRSVMQNRKVIL